MIAVLVGVGIAAGGVIGTGFPGGDGLTQPVAAQTQDAGDDAAGDVLGDAGNLSDAETTIVGNASNDTTGFDVVSAGDVNDDGYQDILVTAPGADHPDHDTARNDTLSVWPWPTATGPPWNQTTDTFNDGLHRNASFNASVDDRSAGVVYLFYGPVTSSALDVSQANVTFHGAPGDQAGWSVTTGNLTTGAGTDIAIGAPGNASRTENISVGPFNDSGAVYIVNGSAALPSQVNLSTDADAVYQGSTPTDRAGHAVATVPTANRSDEMAANARDDHDTVRGTGRDGLLVGAPFDDRAGENAGAVFMVTSVTEGGGDLTTMANATYTGAGPGSAVGWAVADAGDVTDNGSHEIIIGAPYNQSNATENRTGAAYVVSPEPLKTTAQPTALNDTNASRRVNVTEGVALHGVGGHDGAGWAVDTAGDTNGDGNSDVIVGAPGNNSTGPAAGAAYVVNGTDIADDNLSLADARLTVYGEGAGDHAGWSVAGRASGDLICNGYDDVIIGAPFNASTDTDGFPGAAYIVEGSAPVTERTLTRDDGRLRGAARTDAVGWAVASGGEATGDNASDVLVGSPLANTTGGATAGVAAVIAGDCPMAPPDDTEKRPRRDRPRKTPPTPPEKPTPPPAETERQIDSCMTIDEPGSYELTRDLVDRPEPICIAIRASDVTLDGNGHTVDGTDADASVGIGIYGSRTTRTENVTVRDLQAEDWGTGIQVSGVQELPATATLEDVVTTDNEGDGILLAFASGSELQEVRATENHNGIAVWNTDDITVESTTAAANTRFGIELITQVTDGDLTDITATDNGRSGISIGRGGGESHVSITGVAAADNGEAGLQITDQGTSTIQNAVIERNDNAGIRLEDTATTRLTDVTIRENTGWQLQSETTDAAITATRLMVGDDANVTFSEESVSLNAVDRDELPGLPPNASAIGTGFTVDGVADSINATLRYDDDDINADNIALWRYNGTAWTAVANTSTTSPGVLRAAISTDGVFAPIEYTPRDDDAIEEPIDFIDCQTADIHGNYTEAEVSIAYYSPFGFDTEIIHVENLENTTRVANLTAAGINGYAIGAVSLYNETNQEVATALHPDNDACTQAIRPAMSTIEYDTAEALTNDTIDVTFAYTNPNTDGISPAISVTEGQTTDLPPTTLDPGDNTFTVTWTPQTDNETLMLELDMTRFGYTDPNATITAATPPASTILNQSLTNQTTPTETPADTPTATPTPSPTPTETPQDTPTDTPETTPTPTETEPTPTDTPTPTPTTTPSPTPTNTPTDSPPPDPPAGPPDDRGRGPQAAANVDENDSASADAEG